MNKRALMELLDRKLSNNTDYGLVDDIETTEDGIDRIYVFWDKK